MKPAIQTDAIVGLVLKGQPLIGRVLSCKGSRASISFGGQRRDQELPQRDLAVIEGLESAASRDPLPTPEAIQDCVVSARAVAETWWLLISDHKGSEEDLPSLSLVDLADLVMTTVTLASVAAVWDWLHGPQLWFRLRRDRSLQVRPLTDIQRQRKRTKQQRLLIQRQERQLELLRSPQPLTAERREQLDPEWCRTLERLQELALGDERQLLDDAESCEQLQRLSIEPSRRSLRHWLMQRDLLDPDQPIGLRGSVWSATFEAELLEAADELKRHSDDPQPGDPMRVDLSEHRVYTLDDSGTREIDDGLSLVRDPQGDWIWIHIADPARLIEAGSPLDLEARSRATSLYLAEGVRPMLPLGLAADVLSLRAGQTCAALSAGVRLDADGAVQESKICRSWVRPRYGLSYDDGDELIELAPPGDEDLADLSLLLQRRQRWRERQGAIGFDRPEGRFRRQEDGPALQVIEPTAARRMVSEAMLLMGAVVADFGVRHDLALPFRSQPPADLPSTAELQAIPEGPARDAAIKRCLSRGVQGTSPMPHFSLGLASYVQATSPIRRYADLVSHRQLIASLEGQTPLDKDSLGELIGDLDSPLRQAIQISREDQRHWQQVWLSKHREQTWTALFLRWLRPQDRLALVHVADLAMDLVGVADGIDAKPGQPLQMSIQHVDPDQGELRIQLEALRT